MSLLVLDGNSIANRAFYGIKLLTTREGRFTNAIFGFLNILQSLLKETSPTEVAVAFDLKAPTFRHLMYDGYKATRHGMPEELAQQMPVLKELLSALGFRLVTAEGWEADDILGTLSRAYGERGEDVFLATGDRDSLQLVSPQTKVLLAATVMGRSTTLLMDEAAIFEKYSLTPPQLIQLKSLMGDTSDNIPGVKGIGEKTALGLVQRFGSLEGVYEHLDDPFIKPKQRENLIACKADADLSLVLGTIRRDAPVPTEDGSYLRGDGDPARALALLKELEMTSMIDRFRLREAAARQAEAAEAEGSSAAPEGTAAAAADAASACPFLCPLPETPQGRYILHEENGARYALSLSAEGKALALHPLSREQLLALLETEGAALEVFDSAPLYALALENGGEGKALVWDAKLAGYLLDAGMNRYTVENLCSSYGIEAAFSLEAYPEAGSLPGLFARLHAELKDKQQEELYRTIEFPLARVLADMSRVGVLVDAEGIRRFGKEISAALEEAQEKVFAQVGYTFNLNSPKQLGEALFEKMGLAHGKKTKSGWATDAATLKALEGQAPVITDILAYRTYQKLNSTYVEGLLKAIGADGRIHSRFNQTEARTGRLSSDEPNLQNIPIRTELGSRLRAYFIPEPGWLLLDADYSQIELRILAHASGDKAMRKAFLEGEDIHRATAATIYGISPIEVTPAQRSRAKTINFGIMYGKGAYSLSQDLDIPVYEAEEFLKQYLAAFPTVDRYMKDTIEQARKLGYTTTLFGRRRALPELASSNYQLRMSGERMARNTPIQGTAADIIKLAMVRVWQRLRAEGLRSRLILTVHDELIIEAPPEEAEAAGRILQQEMQQAAEYSVPLTVELGRGRSWLEAH